MRFSTQEGGWTSETLEKELITHGPLWCSVVFDTWKTAHVIVVKGIDNDGKVIFLNPHPIADPKVARVMTLTIARFNKCLQWMDYAMMYLRV